MNENTSPVATPDPAELAADLRVALARTVRQIRQHRPGHIISDGQYSVLNRVACAGPQTPRALAEFDHVQPPSMTKTIACLVDAGLLVRTKHPVDGRQVLVDLTDAGRAEVAETRGRRTAWLASRIADLDPDERATLAQAVTILDRMVTR